MNITELTNGIESIEYEIRFSVLSGFKSVLSAMQIDETVNTLIQTIRENRRDAEVVLKRIQTLADDKPQAGYMHRYDIEVLVYLYALNAVDYPDLTLAAVEKVHEIHGFFWAYKLAEHIQEKQERRVSNHSMAEKRLSLNSIVQKAISEYVTPAYRGKLYYARNADEGLHTVLFVPDNDYPVAMETEVIVMARVVNDTVIIEQDTTDRPLAHKLEQNGIPHEQIIMK